MKIFVLPSLFIACCAGAQTPAHYVNPFIGTANSGNTYPNAVAPQGMISVGPQNVDLANKPGYFATSYVWGEPRFFGISHTNISGVGCPDGGSLLLFPQSDSVSVQALQSGVPFGNEKAGAGWYACNINQNIKFRAAATTRAAIDQFEFSGTNNFLVLNLGRSLSKAKGASVRILSGTEMAGYRMEGRFCNRSPERKLYFVLQLQKEAKDFQFIEDGKLKGAQTKFLTGNNTAVVIQLQSSSAVQVKIGISYVSEAGARANLKQEIPGWNVEQVQQQTTAQWNRLLSTIQVQGGSKEDRIQFYTALYHTLLHPNIINDADGRYPLMGNQQGTGRLTRGNRYTVFSLWDTYRNVHPFLTLVYPQLQQEMLQTMVDMYRESGQLPKWEIGAGESYTMVGDPAVPVLADSYLKGITNFDIRTAYKAMLQQADTGLQHNFIRPGYKAYLRYGYIPNNNKAGDYVWGSVSTALEYFYADWCIAQLAKALGDDANSGLFAQRAAGYRHYFDSSYGLLRPKLADGTWLPDFEPLDNWRELGWKPSGGPGFVEGSSWQYSWFVPHDIPGLVKLMGGPQIFTRQLQTCFDSGYFVLSNEPDMAYPWLFNYVNGEAHRTKKIVARCIRQYFGVGPDGLPGNDDCGTLSAWLLFAMMGFYPDCPGSVYYQTALPVFDSIQIKLNPKYYKKRWLLIENKEGVMWVNGRKVGSRISHTNMVNGW